MGLRPAYRRPSRGRHGRRRPSATCRSAQACWTSVPVIWLDATLGQARLLGLALNRISGTWDDQLLARLLADIVVTHQLDVSLSVFAKDEIADLLRSLDVREKRERPEDFDFETALDEASRTSRTNARDLWLLGEHRLLCGSAAEQADVDRLLDGRRAAMAFTDPPYNVSLGDHGGYQRGGRRRRIVNDSLEPAAWEAFVRAWGCQLLASVDGALYARSGHSLLDMHTRVLEEEGGHWSDTLIWVKDRFVLGRADYHHWCGDRDQGDVWQIARPSDSPLHPTMKPLPLIERAIGNSSRAGDRVLDLFLGSGSTVIAAERTGRRCVGLELDLVYVDVTVTRWERFTGQRAEKLDG
jgi:DNA modification methylase